MHLSEQPNLEIAIYPANEKDPTPLFQKPGLTAGWIFHTDDCKEEIERLRREDVRIVLEPVEHPWGIHAVFADLYGNQFSLVQPIQN